MTKEVCIAHGGDISEPSGGTNRVIAFCKALSDNGFDVSLVVPKPRGKIPEDLQNSITLHYTPIRAGSIKNMIFRALLVSNMAKKISEKNKSILQIEHSTLAGIANLLGCNNFILDMHDISFASPLYDNLFFSKLVKKIIYNYGNNPISTKLSFKQFLKKIKKESFFGNFVVIGDKNIKCKIDYHYPTLLNFGLFKKIKTFKNRILFNFKHKDSKYYNIKNFNINDFNKLVFIKQDVWERANRLIPECKFYNKEIYFYSKDNYDSCNERYNKDWQEFDIHKFVSPDTNLCFKDFVEQV